MIGAHVVAVTGPSGVGKDSLITALAMSDRRLRSVRRVITRHADATEPFLSVDEPTFDAMAQEGAFLLHWTAHGLRYGIPLAEVAALDPTAIGLTNLSRGVLDQAARTISRLTVLSVTAPTDVLARRLSGRGRESSAQIAERLARPRPAPPEGVDVIEIDNGGPLDRAVEQARAALLETSS